MPKNPVKILARVVAEATGGEAVTLLSGGKPTGEAREIARAVLDARLHDIDECAELLAGDRAAELNHLRNRMAAAEAHRAPVVIPGQVWRSRSAFPESWNTRQRERHIRKHGDRVVYINSVSIDGCTVRYNGNGTGFLGNPGQWYEMFEYVGGRA